MPTPQLPREDDPPLTWARFYRSLGWIPLWVRSHNDLPAYRDYLSRKNPTWSEDQLEVGAKAGLKHPAIEWRRGRDWVASPPTDEEMREFWADEERGIFLLTGPGTGLTVIDIDTYKEGYEDGTTTAWEAVATVIASSNRGGLHLYFAEDASAKTDNDQRGRGIDIRAKGGGVVAPSGTGSVGREFVRWELPLAPYPAPVVAPAPVPKAPPLASSTFTIPAGGMKAGSFAEAVGTARPDGTKNRSAKIIVGMLCRPQSLPPDAMAAALGLLDGQPLRELMLPGWEAALGAASVRPKSFVVQFILAWNSLRCDPPWPDDKAADTAGSLWQTASSSQAAAVTMTLEAMPGPSAGQPPTVAAVEVGAEPAASGVTFSFPIGDAAYAVADERALLDQRCPTGRQAYTAAKLERNRQRKMLSCARLPGNLTDAGNVDTDLPYGTGLGKWLNDAMGRGIMPGYFMLLVAKKAKAGKTAFMDQLMTGLTMEGAQNYLNALEGRRTGPIIQPWIISEMDADELEERSLARYIGCDQDIFRCGDSAVDAPGVRKTAARLKISPAQVVEQIFSRAHRVQSEGSLFQIATGLRRYVTPENYGPGACGPMLIEAVAADMAAGRFYLAQDAGVPVEDVWQILFVDPIQRFIDPQFGDVPGVDGLAKCLRRHANGAGDEKRRMIVFVTSDTNKASASEPSKPEVKVQGKLEVSLTSSAMVARATRGSYSLCHLPDAAMLLDTMVLHPNDIDEQDTTNAPFKKRASIHLGFSRWSQESDQAFPFFYYPASGRFVAIEPPSAAVPEPVGQATNEPGEGAKLSFNVKRTEPARAAKAAKAAKRQFGEDGSTPRVGTEDGQ